MSQKHFSAVTLAKASVQRKFLDARMARQHLSLVSFAHELELVQERCELGVATAKLEQD
jgi:hypothetical protein